MRNAEFNRQEVLRLVMAAFMQKGYTKTSMQDLSKASGLHPGSIYCAFENKRGLLLAALEQYKQDQHIEFTCFFDGSRPILCALKIYLDDIVSKFVDCDVDNGCLFTKTLNEIAGQDEEVRTIIVASLAAWQQALTDLFTQAKLSGELVSLRESDHLARYLVMGIYGLRTFAQTQPGAKILQQLADQLYDDLCGE
ncbi:TetR/AcrR family transcriptional regulator [Psychromonas antarctica]|uniref:TetR/AcrR family transcriptional regulator n=1 Tax=Psychromonas antarctica TaxID=67573 RepID=UPI001EE7C909|nr:TetR/AcrR family transcriptional regulator [Psychromonas antarctica]MCG6201597.1 TetR/AcrR family transcriptional regulator [Psychromonas antarctica]